MGKPIDLKELENDDEVVEKTAQTIEPQRGDDHTQPAAADFPASGSKAWN